MLFTFRVRRSRSDNVTYVTMEALRGQDANANIYQQRPRVSGCIHVLSMDYFVYYYNIPSERCIY